MKTKEEIFKCPVCMSDITDELPPHINAEKIQELGKAQIKNAVSMTDTVIKEKELARDMLAMSSRRLRWSRIMMIVTIFVALFYTILAITTW